MYFKGRERDTSHSTGSLSKRPKLPQILGLGQAKPGNRNSIQVGSRDSMLDLLSAASQTLQQEAGLEVHSV